MPRREGESVRVSPGAVRMEPRSLWRCGWLVALLAEESVDEYGVARPGAEDDGAGDLSAGVAQGEGDDDDVVERADHGQELRNEIDRRDDPNGGDCDGDLRPAGYPGIAPECAQHGGAAGKERGEVLGDAVRQPSREDDEDDP